MGASRFTGAPGASTEAPKDSTDPQTTTADHLTHSQAHPNSSTPVGSPCFPLFGMRLSLVVGAGGEELDGCLHCQNI